MSYEQYADQEYALEVGRMYPERAWICSDRDVWYANPFYNGPPARHPEDYDYNEGCDDPAPDYDLTADVQPYKDAAIKAKDELPW